MAKVVFSLAIYGILCSKFVIEEKVAAICGKETGALGY
ncbi:hypothetical protein SpAn4DRAFT_2069 [Sporomusa ovata]|uniref:Uncharacterized protein n=1 Tax=Sporomusa ovata TaxID=2378 RepID=A0A0U1KUG3_9FIRM|nr:hypothetical protein SpAn4DRAFT_2069 [Sporomusa ovata]